MRINNIIQLLKVSDHYGQSKDIDIAKGLNEYTSSTKKIFKQEMRKYHGRKKGY
jgi:hypothetical protein